MLTQILKHFFAVFSLYFIFQLYGNKFAKCADKTFLKKTLQFFCYLTEGAISLINK